MINLARKMEHIFLKQHNYNNYRIFILLLINFVFGWLIIGCESNKTVQCEQFFLISRQVTNSFQDISNVDEERSLATKYWLEAASRLNNAADKIDALKIDDSQLIQYQNQLATVYRIYSQATYDAVRARENKNLAALETARHDAKQAGKMQQDLIKEINAFCLRE